VVLEKNLFEVEPRQIHKIKVLLTLLEGETVCVVKDAFHQL
jgi:predicted amidohydrolase YtcJ